MKFNYVKESKSHSYNKIVVQVNIHRSIDVFGMVWLFSKYTVIIISCVLTSSSSGSFAAVVRDVCMYI